MKSSEVRKAGDRSNSTLNIMMTSILKNSLMIPKDQKVIVTMFLNFDPPTRLKYNNRIKTTNYRPFGINVHNNYCCCFEFW